MLTIRFSRIGKRKKAFFRIIISEKQKDTQGTYLELLGNYDPHTKATVLKTDRIQYWLSKGATMSNSVHNLFINKEIVKGEKQKSVAISKKRATTIAAEKEKTASNAVKAAEDTKAKEAAAKEAKVASDATKAAEEKAATEVVAGPAPEATATSDVATAEKAE